MKIAVASGKGGTGKTTFSVALALANRDRARLVDCDVEEPNAHLFLRGGESTTASVWASVPVVDASRCDSCGRCASFCQYNALALAGSAGLMVFPELCHDCGGCILVCPSKALSERKVLRGTVETRVIDGTLELVTGRLEVGSPSAPTVIRAAIENPPALQRGVTIFDAPPGTACSFASCVHQADHCVLVTDPTPFGLHDLELAIEAIQAMTKPFSVVINRSSGDDDLASRHCRRRGIPVLLRIPERREIAECYSNGGSLLDADSSMGERLRTLLDDLHFQVSGGPIQ
ncbi:MAG TPA: ATP-binding protein [Fibrobacteria bacterium]|nr:ATP-binding protein [Fibrobacteria bacterium]